MHILCVCREREREHNTHTKKKPVWIRIALRSLGSLTCLQMKTLPMVGSDKNSKIILKSRSLCWSGSSPRGEVHLLRPHLVVYVCVGGYAYIYIYYTAHLMTGYILLLSSYVIVQLHRFSSCLPPLLSTLFLLHKTPFSFFFSQPKI